MGDYLSIDESMHGKDLFTFFSDKDGHGKRGTLIAAVRGTNADVSKTADADSAGEARGGERGDDGLLGLHVVHCGEMLFQCHDSN